jgi:energy-coupling factor transport system ATP-binding protein
MPIVIKNLYYTYMNGGPFEKAALHDVNIEINDGEFIGIIGHTGSGKSTLIQHLNGILKPTKGQVIINNIDTLQKDLKELRRQVGIVFQYPEHQLFEETVKKDVSFGLVKQGISSEEVEKRVNSAILSVGLDESVLDKSPFELSGGQKRRVAIAGVVAMKPQILVLDEPTAGLDPRGRDEIFGFIKKLHEESSMTIILVSHSMEDVAKLTKRVIVMNEGTVFMDKSSGEIYSHPEELENIGLSAPQITYLMKQLKKNYPDINDNVFTVEAAVRELVKYLK